MIGRWAVEFVFATDGYDVGNILTTLYDMGASEDVADSVYELVTSGKLNTGFTFTNAENLSALVAVGPVSSSSEFLDTVVHELHHLSVAIAGNLGIDLEGEATAYLSGDSARELADIICTLGCPHCGETSAFVFE